LAKNINTNIKQLINVSSQMPVKNIPPPARTVNNQNIQKIASKQTDSFSEDDLWEAL
jgi:hypothetical protein